MENENIPQDLPLPHREIKGPSKSLSEVTTINLMGIGQLLLIPHLDPRPTLVSALLGIIQLHQLIGIHSIDPILTRIRRRTRINPNRRRQKRTQPETMMTNKKITSKITHNKDGRCFEIEFYQVKPRENQKLLLGITPSLHSLQPRSHQYRLLPNY
jgi:hypothetical protein